MAIKSLKTRFLLAGGLMALTTISCGVWAALSLRRMSTAVGATLEEGQLRIDLVSGLSASLEREDDGILLAILGRRAESEEELRTERQKFEDDFAQLRPLLTDPTSRELGVDLRRHVNEYRNYSDRVVQSVGQPGLLKEYYQTTNPALRRTVGDCAQLRDVSFRQMKQTFVDARNEAKQGALAVGSASLAALVLSVVISLHLMRRVVAPINVLSRFTDTMRAGHFDQRVKIAYPDELGRLASEFNRLAEALAEHRRFDLGQVLQAKSAMEATLEALQDAVILVEPSGRVASMNRIARQVLNVNGEAGGTEASRELRLDDLPLPPQVLQAIREALSGNPPMPPRADLTSAVSAIVDGHAVKLLPVTIPVPHYHDGARDGAHGAVAVLYDVTEFAKLDELRMELIAVASHELKTPLTTLRMNLLLMKERSAAFDDRQREFLLNSIDGCDELGKTIDELLDLTRADAGQLKLSLERVDLGAVAEDAVRSLRPRFEEAGIALTLENRGQTVICRGDPLRLGMVLTNVLTNALKYTPAGGKVRATVASLQNAGDASVDRVQIAVTDTGPGVPEEFRTRVFEKFFRVEHHRPNDAKQVRGTGIGLYLCRHIIQAHGGEIWCEAGENTSGTRIVVEMPAER